MLSIVLLGRSWMVACREPVPRPTRRGPTRHDVVAHRLVEVRRHLGRGVHALERVDLSEPRDQLRGSDRTSVGNRQVGHGKASLVQGDRDVRHLGRGDRGVDSVTPAERAELSALEGVGELGVDVGERLGCLVEGGRHGVEAWVLGSLKSSDSVFL